MGPKDSWEVRGPPRRRPQGRLLTTKIRITWWIGSAWWIAREPRKRARGDPLAVKSSLGPPSASGFRKWQQGSYFPFISTNKKHKCILTIAIWGIFWAQAFFLMLGRVAVIYLWLAQKTKRAPQFSPLNSYCRNRNLEFFMCPSFYCLARLSCDLFDK